MTWMDIFLILGIAVTTFIIMETCIVYNISLWNNKYPPKWPSTKGFVDVFNWSNIYSVLTCRPRDNAINLGDRSTAYSPMNGSHIIPLFCPTDYHDTNANKTSTNDLNKLGNQTAANKQINPPPTSSTTTKGMSMTHNEEKYAVDAKLNNSNGSTILSMNSSLMDKTNKAKNIHTANYSDTSASPSIIITAEHEDGLLTWKDVADSVDVFAQLFFSIGYFLAMAILFIFSSTQPDEFLPNSN